MEVMEVSKGEKIRNRYNQVPHLTQETWYFQKWVNFGGMAVLVITS